MKRKVFGCLSALLLLCLLASCGEEEPAEESGSGSASEIISEDKSESASEPVSYEYDGEESFSNLTFSNGEGKMGDQDGPAYCVYSTKGVQAASMEIELSQLELQIYREDGAHVNAYIFLGVDVYDPETGYWKNCADAGLVYSGRDGWHVFYNLYSTADPNASTWYESDRRLRDDHDYRLVLDSSQRDGRAVLSVIDITSNIRVDRVIFDLQYAKADGSNTAYLTDFALDYPEDTMQGPDGQPSEDWIDITLGNTDRGIYLRNLRVKNCRVTRDGVEYDWTEEQTANRGIWPDASMTGIDYACTRVRNAKENIAYMIDLDMNR
ncbi:MAG: hypothetical protein J1E00_06085 [Oscillospiraceae bacterium]|nr:hypothetical protein [Oscillospiraceae bacterium]